MPCEHDKDALIELAASGATPQGELRAHLDGCASCRAALDEEQSLFANIDSGLHATANREVPISLLPRVRAKLDGAAAQLPGWSSGWLALAAAATAVAALFLTVRIHSNNTDSLSTSLVSSLPAAPKVVPTTHTPSLSTPPERGKLPHKPSASAARNAPPRDESASRTLSPEILVPRDQEALLASYAKQWSSRVRAPLVASEVVDAKLEPLKVLPIQITGLDVKPLAEESSQ